MRVNLDPLVLQTFGRLAGIRALLELLDRALPDTAWHEREALKAQAAERDWEFGEFDVERQILDERFRVLVAEVHSLLCCDSPSHCDGNATSGFCSASPVAG